MGEDDSQIPSRSASLWPLQVSTFVLKPTAKNVQHRKLKTPKTQILAVKVHTQKNGTIFVYPLRALHFGFC
jgi:hypothetical protein